MTYLYAFLDFVRAALHQRRAGRHTHRRTDIERSIAQWRMGNEENK